MSVVAWGLKGTELLLLKLMPLVDELTIFDIELRLHMLEEDAFRMPVVLSDRIGLKGKVADIELRRARTDFLPITGGPCSSPKSRKSGSVFSLHPRLGESDRKEPL